LVEALSATSGGELELAEDVRRVRLAVDVWPFPVPTEMMRGIGAAQFWAALRELQTRCGVSPGAEPRTVAERALDATERELQRDVPPHHGG
jgi:hypothetical protein